MFQSVSPAPPDSILGLSEAFAKDPNPAKINLGIGVYCDENGQTPVLSSVKEAERRLLASESSKRYLPIDGSPRYGRLVQELLFGPDHEVLASGRCATAHTPGGTAAVRVAADFIRKNLPGATVWLSQPTWPNHPQILETAGLPVRTYPYFNATTNALAWDEMLATLRTVAPGDVVLLHGCCHNPTGIDPNPEQWRAIGAVLRERGALPLIDFAYQGFGRGLREDAAGLLALLTPGSEALIASSFSKNFGLYNERVGALTVVAPDADSARRVQSQVKSVIRANYSNPPAHGGAIVATILGDPELRTTWERELAGMRDRINRMRSLLVETLQRHGLKADFSFIARQLGMFSFSSLNPQQVERLRHDHAVYLIGNGRINVAGITPANVDRLCAAIAVVTAAD